MLKYLQKIEGKEITELSNFKTKAFSEYYFEIHNLEDVDKLKDIVDFAGEENLKILFVGAGTNMLFAFEKYEWIVIKNCLQWWTYNEKTKILKSYSNELISDIAESLDKSYRQNLWHRFIWLPGSVGWAVYGNAGCFGLETENNFREATVYNLSTWKIEKLSKNEMLFNYRTSILKQNNNKYFLVDTSFDLSMRIEKYSSDVDNIDFRENKQPKGNTCWSFFKNPNREQSAWFLIESVWLKWKKINWAFFSELHANFLMSDWTASYKDLLNLIKLAQEKVKKEFWVDIENEVRIIEN